MKDLPQSETDPNKTVSTHLNLQQYQAIELLLIGKSDIEVAQLIGLESNTIWQWRNQNLSSLLQQALCGGVGFFGGTIEEVARPRLNWSRKGS